MPNFDTPLSLISSIKKPTLAKLGRMGIFTVRDMLYHFPHRYEDYSQIRPIDSLVPDEKCTVLGTIVDIKAERTWIRKMLLTKAVIEDTSGRLNLLWFNQRFVLQTLKAGMTIRVSGKVTKDREGLLMSNPAFEKSARDATHTGRLVPVYPETAGLTSKFFRWQLTNILSKLKEFPDPVPQEILDRLHLPSLKQALHYIHFPKNEKFSVLARKRFAFDEMFLVQLKALQVKALFTTAKGTPISFDETSLKNFVKKLPFKLTDAQRKASFEILQDMEKTRPMNRLLNGDVGSGKTVVAALAAFAASEQKLQTVILAPTEVLARQHFESLSKLFMHTEHTLALFTRSYHILDSKTVTRPTLLKAIAAGIPKIIIGTHALLQDDIIFDNLALVVVDEQHRFGVAQRAKLQDMALTNTDLTQTDTDKSTTLKSVSSLHKSAFVPHFLTMTATPIPRTLTLAFFGNLDISFLDEMPKNRKPIITRIATTDTEREKIYAFVRSEIAKGRQAFIIFPLVEESLALKDVKAAVAEHQHLEEKVFPNLSIGLLHGKMPAKEKEQVMRDFSAKSGKKYDILVATAVVEVGIDVPNASIIIIEEAERFGLAQLHQFRGRVGRSEHQSYCFLLPHQHSSLAESSGGQAGKTSNENNERLKALVKTNSGFAIAEADLALRGPGAFFGTRQSGLPDIAMENLLNIKLITIAREEAKLLLSKDPKLAKHSLLASALQKFEEKIHLE